LNFRNESDTITVNGTAVTKKEFTLSDIDTVNRFLKSDAKYATVIETDVGAGTTATDSVAALADNSIASTFISSDKMRFTCEDSSGNKRFVVSENCAVTDPGVTSKAINKFGDVATDVAALTLNTSDYQLCYD
jgi:hypothetical protein